MQEHTHKSKQQNDKNPQVLTSLNTPTLNLLSNLTKTVSKNPHNFLLNYKGECRQGFRQIFFFTYAPVSDLFSRHILFLLGWQKFHRSGTHQDIAISTSLCLESSMNMQSKAPNFFTLSYFWFTVYFISIKILASDFKDFLSLHN